MRQPETAIEVQCWRCNRVRPVDLTTAQNVPTIGPFAWGCKTCKADNHLTRIQAWRLTMDRRHLNTRC